MGTTPPSLEEVLAGIDEQSAYVKNVAIPQLEQQRQKAEEAAAIRQDAITKAGNAAAEVVQQKGDMQQTLEDKLVNMGATMMPEEAQAKIATAMGEAQNMLTGHLDRVQQLNQVDPLSNPLGFVLAQLALPSAQAALTSTQQKIDLLSTAQTQVAQATSATGRAIRETSRTINSSMIAAEKDRISQQAAADAASAAMDAARNNGQFILQEVQLSAQERDGLLQQRRAWMDSEQFKRQQALAGVQMQEAGLRMQEMRERLAKLSKDNEQQAANDDFVANSLAIVKKQATSLGDTGALNMLNGITSIPQLRAAMQNDAFAQKYNYLYSTGMVSANNGGSKVLGTDPYTAVLTATATGVPLTEGERLVQQTVLRAVNAKRADPVFQATYKDKAERQAAEQQEATAALKTLPPLSPSVIATQEAHGAFPVGKWATSQAINFDANPEAQKSVTGFAGQALQAVKDHKITINQAAEDIARMASLSSDASARYYNITGFGGQPNFVVPDTTGKYDLSTKADAYKWVAKQVATMNPLGVSIPQAAGISILGPAGQLGVMGAKLSDVAHNQVLREQAQDILKEYSK